MVELGFIASGGRVLSIRGAGLSGSVCKRKVQYVKTIRMAADDGGNADTAIETGSSPDLVALPTSHQMNALRDLAIAVGVFGTLKVGLGPLGLSKFSGFVNPIGYYAVWLGLAFLPFVVNKDRRVDISAMETRKDKNTDLVAPEGFTNCSPPPRMAAKVFDCSPVDLRNKFFTMVKSQPSTGFLSGDDDNLTYAFVQTTPLMKYPDVISVQFLPSGQGKSTLAIFSTSIFGQSDVGKNKARVDEWLSKLD
ncbi:hypothetical protein NDN08_004764 [Rhodosorus marinus]|uniref:Uncharacterized protein n=1 Tax=Rhodosorus marinus TaxID=101924 RepID=A0AAV8UQS4_9RHOD|nr:hypothetical protein NDN08_004764 [Rhodosorus marinus]